MLFGLLITVAPRTTAKVEAVGRAVKSACLHCGLSMSETADLMGLAPNNLSRQLNEQGINLARLVNLPVSFWRVFLPELRALVGLAADDEDVSLGERVEQQELQIAEQQEQIDQMRREHREQIDQLRELVRELIERHSPPAKERATA